MVCHKLGLATFFTLNLYLNLFYFSFNVSSPIQYEFPYSKKMFLWLHIPDSTFYNKRKWENDLILGHSSDVSFPISNSHRIIGIIGIKIAMSFTVMILQEIIMLMTEKNAQKCNVKMLELSNTQSIWIIRIKK